MHRLLVETALLSEERPALPKGAAQHLKVLRPKFGEEIELFDGRGQSRVYVWETDGLSATSAVQQFAAVKHPLTLFACVTKGSRWDWTIEKATELGVTRIVPVISERTIVRIDKSERAAKRERWQRIAEDAARQSDQKWIPEILAAVDFNESLELVRKTACFIGALTTPLSPMLGGVIAEVLRGKSAAEDGVAVFIGPEGDFTRGELAALMEIATPASFGPMILRAETAAIYALSVLADKLGGPGGT